MLNFFKNNARKFSEQGLNIIPVKEDKQPVISWGNFQNIRVMESLIDRWEDKFPHAQIAIVTGKISNINVIDCDDKERYSISKLQGMFGESTLIVETKKGYHLYYKYNGLKSILNSTAKIDFISDSRYIIAPLSNINEYSYKIIKGDIFSFSELMEIKPNSVEKYLSVKKPAKIYQKDKVVKEGGRNNALFLKCLKFASSTDDVRKIFELAKKYNDNYLSPSLGSDEVAKVVKSVLKYKEKGTLYMAIPISENINALMSIDSFGYVLLTRIFNANISRLDCFEFNQKGYSRTYGCDPKTLRSSLKRLVELNFISELPRKGAKNTKFYSINTENF